MSHHDLGLLVSLIRSPHVAVNSGLKVDRINGGEVDSGGSAETGECNRWARASERCCNEPLLSVLVQAAMEAGDACARIDENGAPSSAMARPSARNREFVQLFALRSSIRSDDEGNGDASHQG
jgi:hypothetical protein